MNAVLTPPKQISLYYRQGSSDKEYHARIEATNMRYIVTFSYGRRGTTLTTGCKTAEPVNYATAERIFDRLVAEKKAKGYTEGVEGTPYQHTTSQPSGLTPQLLNPIDEATVARLVADPDWAMQQKMDGRRLLLQKQGNQIVGINKKGLFVSVPEPILQTARDLNGDFILDGEAVGDHLHVFDLLSISGQDIRHKRYEQRYVDLLNLMASGMPKHISIVQLWINPQDKAVALASLKRSNAEGVVFKRLAAPYTAGRPNSGGDQLKYKFVATVSAVVSKVNIHRSVQLSLLNHEGWHIVGNVTVPPNHEVPTVGEVVEVRYLYAYPDGSLFQPVYLGPREDVGREECVRSQLKFKPTAEVLL